MPRSILRLLYVSTAAPGLVDADVAQILHRSRRNNGAADVTGCLLFTGRHFGQVLEGDPDVVEALAERIARDPRHSAVRVLSRETAAQRRYDIWSMGYVYDMGFEGRIEELCAGGGIDAAALRDVTERMRPDSMFGTLG